MKFTPSHEWIRLEGTEIGVVGITQQAQTELGEVVYIELPIVGKRVKAGDEVAVLESTKAAADIYSPVSGEIVEINTQLKDASEKINTSPESEGWLFKIKLVNPAELELLLDRKSYIALL
ncbi:MAG: glycine cleavage system protein GcvH [Chlamydiales bacterium]|nr:glycine cleavage system protein GcvH [Chlamydiales bacterium]